MSYQGSSGPSASPRTRDPRVVALGVIGAVLLMTVALVVVNAITSDSGEAEIASKAADLSDMVASQPSTTAPAAQQGQESTVPPTALAREPQVVPLTDSFTEVSDGCGQSGDLSFRGIQLYELDAVFCHEPGGLRDVTLRLPLGQRYQSVSGTIGSCDDSPDVDHPLTIRPSTGESHSLTYRPSQPLLEHKFDTQGLEFLEFSARMPDDGCLILIDFTGVET